MINTDLKLGKVYFRAAATIMIIMLVGLTFLVAGIFATHQVTSVYFPEVQALAQFEISLAEGHLWFEEILAGDIAEDPEFVRQRWDESQALALALLHGGETEFGKLSPLQGPHRTQELEELITQLAYMRKVADRRLTAGGTMAAGTPIDQEFDAVFLKLFQSAQGLRKEITSNISGHQKRIRAFQVGLLGAFVLFGVAMWGVFRKFEMKERQHLELIATSEAQYRSMFEGASLGIIVCDLDDPKILFSNPALRTMLGIQNTDDPLTLSHILDPGQDPEKGLAEFTSLVESKNSPILESFCRHQDGHPVPVDISANQIDWAGHPAAIAMFSDKTAIVQAREEKEFLEARLRQSQKMEAVGNLAGGIAHDFNNLLQAILGYSEIMVDTLGCPAEIQEDLKKVQSAAERAAQLTGQLLTFSRRQVIKPVELDLNTTIPEFMSLIERTIGENHRTRFLPGNNLGIVCMDKIQVEQILMNLCLNARDAMGSGGVLTLETENVSLDEDFQGQHRWAKLGRYVLLSVSDNGSGIDPEILPKIFEPFFTTKDVGEGTGLGLSTVYGIVKQNKGLIHPYSEVGSGTVFKIYLPLVERPAVDVGAKLPRQVKGGDETILYADDDRSVRELGQRILEEAGYRVLAAKDGAEALKIFKKHSSEVDLALLDVVMPEMGGRQVSEAIHELRPDTKVLFASGYSQNAIHTDFVLDEGRELLNKPYGVEDILIKVRQILDS